MSTPYRYNEPSTPIFEPLPPGDYDFTVLELTAPYTKPNGNNVLAVKLQVGKENAHIYDNPSQGIDKNGEPFDKIAGFLKSCNRAPAPGQEPNWDRIIGAKGRVHTKLEVAAQGKLAGQQVAKVAWYIFNKDIKQSPQSFTPSQVKQSADEVRRNAGDPDWDAEPSDLPF
jgi:hypothetical protein